jgi:hypothetical protein
MSAPITAPTRHNAEIIAFPPKAPTAKRPDQTPLHDFIDISMGLSEEGFRAWIALGYRMAGSARA